MELNNIQMFCGDFSYSAVDFGWVRLFHFDISIFLASPLIIVKNHQKDVGFFQLCEKFY